MRDAKNPNKMTKAMEIFCSALEFVRRGRLFTVDISIFFIYFKLSSINDRFNNVTIKFIYWECKISSTKSYLVEIIYLGTCNLCGFITTLMGD